MVWDRHIVIGGNDLAGKDLGIGGITRVLEADGKTVFSLDDVFKAHDLDAPLELVMQLLNEDPLDLWKVMLPYYCKGQLLVDTLNGKSFKDRFPNVDVLVVSEPTYVGVGKIIRQEFINEDRAILYRAFTQALAYAFDRTVLNKAFVEPALREGVWVIKSRCEETSIAYQPTMAKMRGEELTVDDVVALPGNDYAITRVTPGLMLQMGFDDFGEFDRIKAERAAAGKDDKAIFETREFQEAAKVLFDTEISKIYGPLGTNVVSIKRGTTPGRTRANVTRAFRNHYKNVA
jgi:thymidylate kinase